MMDDSVDAFSRLASEREGGEELVAEGNSKTDSASNSNDDKHVRIEAGAGARVEQEEDQTTGTSSQKNPLQGKCQRRRAGLGTGLGSQRGKGSGVFVCVYLIFRTRHVERGQSRAAPDPIAMKHEATIRTKAIKSY